MLQPIIPQDEDAIAKYPLVVTFDKGSVWLQRSDKPTKKITLWWWGGISAMFLILFYPF